MARVGRSRPRITWTGGVTRQTGNTTTLGAAVPALGPAPPQIILPLPTQRAQTVMVQTAVHTRRSWNRRFASQNQEQDPVKGLASSPTAYGMLTARAIGPQPPQVVLPLPSLAMMTVTSVVCAVRTRMTMTRRTVTYYKLPSVVEPRLQMPDRRLYVQTALTAVADRIGRKRRKPVWFQTPVLLAQPPPVVTQIQATLAVQAARNSYGRRNVETAYPGPATLEPASVALAERTIRVTVALRNRVDLTRRNVQSFFTVPATLEPASVALAERTVRVALVAVGNRRLHRPVQSVPPKPATLEPASVALAERTIGVTLAATRNRADRVRRAPHSTRPVVTVTTPPFAPVQVTLAAKGARHPARRTNSFLEPPAVVAAPAAPPVVTKIQASVVAVAGSRRHSARATHSNVAPPTALRVFAGPAVTLTVTARLASQPRRATHSQVRPPTKILSPPTLGMQMVQAKLVAWRTRIELTRRAPHYKLAPPAVVHTPVVYTVTLTASNLSIRARLRRCVNRLLNGDTPGTLTMTADTAGTLGAATTDTAGTVTATPDTPGTLTINPDAPGDLGEADPTGCGC